MPKYRCTNATCRLEAELPVAYANVTCTRCRGTMAAVKVGPPIPPRPQPVVPQPQSSAPPGTQPVLITPSPHITVANNAVPKPIAQPQPTPKPTPQPTPQPTPKLVAPPRVDLGELSQVVTAKQTSKTTNATISKVLVFTMVTDAGVTRPFNYPIKYRLWRSDISRQGAEITVQIPIKVYGAVDGPAYWASLGYSADSFSKTVHPHTATGQPAPGVVAANITDEVKKKWSAKINKAWGKVGVVWTTAKEVRQFGLKFEFGYVDDIADAAAGVICVRTTGPSLAVNPTGTIDAIRWGLADTDENALGPICHEVGHLIGNPDEYFTITYKGQTRNWGDGYQTGDGFGIMNNPDRPALIRYYKHLAVELALAFGIPLDEAEVVEDLAMISNSRRHKLSAHIWG